MKNIAVLTFPGNNCEVETVRAIKKSGMNAEVFLWNRTPSELLSFDGVVIPGGFSFEDRGRSGVISAQEPIFDELKKMAKEGKPILGICNGAQMLVESGLILVDSHDVPALSLARNERKNEEGEILGTGFYHNWVTLNPKGKITPFNNFSHTVFVPIAHGEGRFVFPDEVADFVMKNNLIVFSYVDADGKEDLHFPTNPNGSFEGAAGVCNPAGNVVAIMPHPERSEDGKAVFDSLFQFFQNKDSQLLETPLPNFTFQKREKKQEEKSSFSFFISLKITDKAEKTFENLLQRKYHHDISLSRGEKWSFMLKNELSLPDLLQFAEDLVRSNEVLNINKESVLLQKDDQFFLFEKEKGFIPSKCHISENSFCVREKKDFFGESKMSHLNALFPLFHFSKISFGVTWDFTGIEADIFLDSPLFASFVSEEIYEVV